MLERPGKLQWLERPGRSRGLVDCVLIHVGAMNKPAPPRSPNRRIRFALVVLVSQLLLIALAASWAVHMIIIAEKGSVYFVEGNLAMLWTEIALTVVICIFGATVFIMQLRRLSERRGEDRRS
jgi:hypothetical protein